MPEQIGEHFTSVQRFYPSDRFPDEIDALDVPETYVSVAKGDCLEPAFHDGDYLVFSKTALLHKGDYVGIWFAPDIVPDCETPRQIKRLAMEPMSTLTLPWSATSDDELEPHVHLEMFNPPRKLKVPASRLVAMHKVVGIAEPTLDVLLDDMTLLAQARHGSAHGVRLPASCLGHLFEARTGSGLQQGEQLSSLGDARCFIGVGFGHGIVPWFKRSGTMPPY